jgi:hypothetical protein
MIPEETVQAILAATDIVTLIAESLELKRAGTSFKANCPFHNEKSPSFNVNPQRQTFHCFGCQAGGDAIKWERMYFDKTFVEACERLAARAGIPLSSHSDDHDRSRRAKPRRKRVIKRDLPDVPDLDEGNPAEHRALAKLRGLDERTIRAAMHRGFLRFCWWNEKRSWIVTDKTRVNAQVRHLDGSPLFFTSDGKGIKAQTVSSSWSRWPLGAADIRHRDVLICEGGPDFLAAIELIEEFELKVSPVGILGASMPIHDKALPFFRNKVVHVAEHTGQAGQDATARWAAQLEGIASVIACPMPDDDLNQAIVDYGPRGALNYLPYRTEMPF